MTGDIDIALRDALVAVRGIGRVRREENKTQFDLVGQNRPGRSQDFGKGKLELKSAWHLLVAVLPHQMIPDCIDRPCQA